MIAVLFAILLHCCYHPAPPTVGGVCSIAHGCPPGRDYANPGPVRALVGVRQYQDLTTRQAPRR